MNKLTSLFFCFLASLINADQTVTTQAQQNVTSAQNSNALNCTSTQVDVAGQCVEIGSCASKLLYFRQQQASNGTEMVPNKPLFSLALSGSNLQVSLTFQNGTGLLTNLEGDSCLTVSLHRYSIAFTNEVNDSTTISSTLNTDGTRTWAFIIDKSNFATYLSQDIQTNYTRYSGFYSVNIDYNGAVVKKQISSIAFRFVANFTTDLTTIQGVAFEPKMRGDPACADTAQTNCVQQAQSNLILCGTDSTCQNATNNTELVVGETYYVQQQITQSGFTGGNWKPANATITVQADGITKTIQPKIFNQTSNGTIYEVKFNFLANNVTIASDATLSQSRRRILDSTSTSGASAVGTTTSTCVKTSSTSTCPTASEVTTYNAENCSTDSCDSSTSYGQIYVVIAFCLVTLF